MVRSRALRALAVSILFFNPRPALSEVSRPSNDRERREVAIHHLPRPNLSSDIPRYHEYYRWVITGKLAGVQAYPSGVPLVSIESGRTQIIATIPLGSEISLTKFMTIQGRQYFAITAKGHSGQDVRGWVDGATIERDDANSFSTGH